MSDELNTTDTEIKFRFSEEAAAGLTLLRHKMGEPSRAEVIRHALQLLEWAVDEVAQGHEIAAFHGPGRGVKIFLPWEGQVRNGG